MKSLAIAILTWSAKRLLDRYKPTIIAVTGSVGKTSTKDAIALVLTSRFRVRATKKNLNSEIGVPLTILGIDNPGKSYAGWIVAIMKAVLRVLYPTRNYPTHLVLEFGADRPGDIQHLTTLAPPTVGVVTAITHVHVENYPSFDALIAEKTQLVKALPTDGLAILNADEEIVMGMASATSAPVVTYGFGPDAMIDGQNYTLNTREDFSFEPGETLAWSQFTVENRTTKESVDVVLKNAIGIHQAYDCLAAVAVGNYFGIDVSQAAKALEVYASPAGRLKPLLGIKGSLLLDDTYNAAPSSTKAALDVLAQFHPAESARRIAVLGKMAELGSYSEDQHRQVGWKAAECAVDLLVCVGEEAKGIADGAIEAGMKPAQIKLCKDSVEAGRLMDREVKKGDIVLIKGSQSARMERATKDLLADPSRASELLVRQEPAWMK